MDVETSGGRKVGGAMLVYKYTLYKSPWIESATTLWRLGNITWAPKCAVVVAALRMSWRQY